jgi:hypothetical protein
VHASLRPAAAALSVALGLVALTGCSVSVTKAVSADTVAGKVADALEREVGQRPEMDCGDDDIDFVAGTEVDCVLTDPSTGSSFDAAVTLEPVDDSDELGVAVQVAEPPRG